MSLRCNFVTGPNRMSIRDGYSALRPAEPDRNGQVFHSVHAAGGHIDAFDVPRERGLNEQRRVDWPFLVTSFPGENRRAAGGPEPENSLRGVIQKVRGDGPDVKFFTHTHTHKYRRVHRTIGRPALCVILYATLHTCVRTGKSCTCSCNSWIASCKTGSSPQCGENLIIADFI